MERASCAAVLVVAAGCAGSQVEPVIVSSAGASGYALRYPDAVQHEVQRLEQSEQLLVKLPDSLGSRRAELQQDVDPKVLRVIVDQADEAGRSEAYADAMRHQRGLRAFWEEARGPVTARVHGAVKKRLQESGGKQDVELDGVIRYALSDGIDRESLARARAHNEAHLTIEMQQAALGRGNVKALERLADDIAYSSYLVNVALVELRDRLQHLLAERDDVEATLEAALERERAYQQGEHTPAEKRASEARVEALERSRAGVAEAAQAAQTALENIDGKIEDARARHATAIQMLRGA